MKKNNILSFYIINILTAIFEIALIMFLVYVFTEDFIKSVFLGGIWLVLGLLGFALLKVNQKNESIYDDETAIPESFMEEFNLIKEKAKKHLKKDVRVYSSEMLPNPAGALNEEVILVNPNFVKSKDNQKILRGVIAHEFGHIASGLINHSPISFIHFSAIFQFLFYFAMLLYFKNKKKNIFLLILTLLLAIIAVLLNIPNYLSVFYFYKKDEHLANYNAIYLGGAEELRTYYYYHVVDDKLFTFLDVKHPSAKKMLERLDEWMGKNEFEKRIFICKHRVEIINTKGYGLSYGEMKFKFYRHHQNEDLNYKYEYAECLFYGEGVEKNIEKALKLYKEIDYNEAKHMVGMCYMKLGQTEKALKIFLKNPYFKSRYEGCKLLISLERSIEATLLLEEIKERLTIREYNALKSKIKLEEEDV